MASEETVSSNQVRSRRQTGFKRNCWGTMSKPGDREQPDRVLSDVASCIHICAGLQSILWRQGRDIGQPGRENSQLLLPALFLTKMTKSRCLYLDSPNPQPACTVQAGSNKECYSLTVILKAAIARVMQAFSFFPAQ